MAVDVVRVNVQGKEQLTRLKKYTGIENWNILCRWALCTSLAEPGKPPPINKSGTDGVEMAWRVFGGMYHEIYLALVRERCKIDGLDTDDGTTAEQIRLHLHRGLGYLVANTKLRKPFENGRRSTRGLLELVVDSQAA